LRPFGRRFSKSPAITRQWPLPPNSALLGEFSERRLEKYIGHWARKSPAAGVGRLPAFKRFVRAAAEARTAAIQTRMAVYGPYMRGGPHFGARHAELQMVRKALGDVPLVGFFAGGEIARHHLYGYTSVLTMFATPG